MTDKKKSEKTEKTEKKPDKVAELSKSVAATKGKFLRHLQSKSPDVTKLCTLIVQHENFIEEYHAEALSENERMHNAVKRLKEVEDQKQELLRDLQGDIPETGDPVED